MTTFERIKEITIPGTVYLGRKEMDELRHDRAYLGLVSELEHGNSEVKIGVCSLFEDRESESRFEWKDLEKGEGSSVGRANGNVPAGNSGDDREVAGSTPAPRARAEQLARLHDEIYVTLAEGRDMHPKPTTFDELPDSLRQLRVDTAAKILDEGYKTPEEAEKMAREQSRLIELYFETAKAVGLQPDDNFEDGPKKARALAAMVSRWEALAVDRALKLAESDRTEEEIPLPGSEVKNKPGWNELLDFAAGELYDAARGYALAERPDVDLKCNQAAQALLEIKVMLDNPMKTIRKLAADRDLWQMKGEALEEKLALTEIALGQTQDTMIDLTKGHDKMIRLLERLARFMAWIQEGGERPMHEGTEDNVGRLGADVAALLNSGDVRVVDV